MTITTNNLKCLILTLEDEFDSYAEDVKEKERNLKIKEERIDAIKDLAHRYAGINGVHHKQWLIDQILRVLLAGSYNDFIAEYNSDNSGDSACDDWDEGIAP
jgi:hypothetical protein